ncbi:MAG TPA: hypothetical protein VMZ53_01910, partial [Kofleriaceae bacterium]|nr:hypothetical protein [Kofleriaceae bacterium]
MRALEQHLGRIRNAGSGLLHYSMWDDHGREHATEEYAREMEALRAESMSAREAGLAGLRALVPVV